MTEPHGLKDRIHRNYAGLSDKLRLAADYVTQNPLDMATRSLRALAVSSGVSPATFSRLARALGYESYEDMREDSRRAMGHKLTPFSERAHVLRTEGSGQEARSFLHAQALACIANIEVLDDEISNQKLDDVVGALQAAGQVLLVGSMGSAGLVDYFGYLADWFNGNWRIAGRNGTALSATLSRMGAGDVVFALSKAPYARRSIAALQSARARGISTIVITDSHASPSLEYADHAFVVPTDSPQFFSSYVGTLVLIETIISLLLVRAGPGAEESIRAAEQEVSALGESWEP